MNKGCRELFSFFTSYQPRMGQRLSLVFNRAYQDFDKDDRFQPVVSELSANVHYTFRF